MDMRRRPGAGVVREERDLLEVVTGSKEDLYLTPKPRGVSSEGEKLLSLEGGCGEPSSQWGARAQGESKMVRGVFTGEVEIKGFC